jgi:hypothetical protein
VSLVSTDPLGYARRRGARNLNPFLLGVIAVQLLILWTWLWPRRWWERLRNLPAIGYQGAADFVRSLIALSLSAWLLIGAVALVFALYGRHQPPTVLVVLTLAPLLIWVSVFFFGFPQFLIPPGARDQADLEDMESLRE